MNTRNLLTGFFLVLALLTQGALAVSCARKSGSVTVVARGPAGLRIEGKGSEVSVEDSDSALTFKVPLAPLDTGVGLRDQHLQALLEADRYPAATLRISRSALSFPKEHEPVEGTAEGELTLHGQSRPVQVRYRAERAAGGVTRVRGSFQVDVRDFDIKMPSYLGVSVAPKIEVNAELAMKGA
jgi:polyisoprenoid-binding protein YceI